MTYCETRIVTPGRSFYPMICQAGNVYTTIGDQIVFGGPIHTKLTANDNVTCKVQIYGANKVADMRTGGTLFWAKLEA